MKEERPDHDSPQPAMSFFEALNQVDATQNYEYDFQQYIGYGMKRDEEVSLDKYGSAATWSENDSGFDWYIRSFKIDNLGIAALLHIVRANENRLERILDIATFRKEGKQVYFGTLWEPGPRSGTQSEIPHRLGVFFYEHPDEIQPGRRITPDYLIDMKDKELLIHEPSGEDERLFLFQDPNPW